MYKAYKPLPGRNPARSDHIRVPVLADNVTVGVGAKVLGPIPIGNTTASAGEKLSA
jgi:serine acetyltransferase